MEVPAKGELVDSRGDQKPWPAMARHDQIWPNVDLGKQLGIELTKIVIYPMNSYGTGYGRV